MMVRERLLLFVRILALAPSFLLSSAAGLPFQVSPSLTHYGPDGPWQAIHIALGENQQPMDLFPGGPPPSIVFSLTKCSHSAVCGGGGLFNQATSSSYIQTNKSSFPSCGGGVEVPSLQLDCGTTYAYGLDTLSLITTTGGSATLSVQNLSFILYSNVNETLGTGIPYPRSAGKLALGPPIPYPQLNGSFTTAIQGNASYIPGQLQKQGSIPSNSFGLHYGSAGLQDLSLWLGGYDEQRLVGPVSTQQTHPPSNGNAVSQTNLVIDLLDVEIGVETGGSPFPFPSKQGLLTSNKTSTSNALPVTMDPGFPYLGLPNSTCNAIAATLPMTYNATLGLYLWDITSPEYKPIITSPSYLSFVFRLSALSNANLTINVPFSLLNLTLEPPLVPEPTSYFPCQVPDTLDPDSFYRSYSLGRAFLQAAFVGANWDAQPYEWYLAQASGPNIATEQIPVAIGGSASVKSSNNTWADTWAGHWTPLAADGVTPAAGPSLITPLPSPGRLSGGAIAGIVIGVLVGVGLVIAGATMLSMKRRRQRQRLSESVTKETAMVAQQQSRQRLSSPESKFEMADDGLQEMAGTGRRGPWELPDRRRTQGNIELDGTNHVESRPIEMPGTN